MKLVYVVSVLLLICLSNLNSQNLDLKKADKTFFIENKGQWPSEVKYLAKIRGLDTWITENGVVYDYYKIVNQQNVDIDNKINSSNSIISNEGDNSNIKGHVIKLEMQGINDEIICDGIDRSNTYYNYFKGRDPSKWASNVRLYKEVKVRNVYNGIDARYYFDEKSIRYDYIVQPGADINQISLKFEGQERVKVNDVGELVFQTSLGEVKHAKLLAYQPNNPENFELNETNEIQIIDCGFIINSNGTIGFEAENYAKDKPLVIDPLVYSTFIGGSDRTVGLKIALDGTNNAYITGVTFSNDYPTTVGAYDGSFNGSRDIFISKLSSDGSSLIYSTFLGGSNYDDGISIALDEYGNSYIAGRTESANFPTTLGAYDENYHGGYDACIIKLSSDGSSLLYSTFIGGINNDKGTSIALDGSNNAYIMGSTSSPDYPTTLGAYDQFKEGNYAYHDVFVSKLSTDGSSLIYSTFIGGSDQDGQTEGQIILDESNNAYLCGLTASTDFPTTTGSYDEDYNGGQEDGFLCMLSSDGSSLVYSTFIGGSIRDRINSIVLDASNNVYITGETISFDFPTTINAYDRNYHGGNGDVFVSKLSSDLSTLLFSSFIGGSNWDSGKSIDIDCLNNVYITGRAESINFPTTIKSYDNSHNGLYDCFLIKLSSDGSSLDYSTFLGGSNYDDGISIILDNDKYAYILGKTMSLDFPTTSGAYDQSFNGNEDIFVMKFELPTPTLPVLTTLDVSSITMNSAVSGGHITYNGGAEVINRGVCWNTVGNPTTNDNHTSDGSGLGTFISNITGLSQLKTYFVRAYAINSIGTAYGDEVTFKTDNIPPVASCKNATVILNQNGNASITVSDIDNGSYDNDAIETFSLSQTSFGCPDIGDNTVTLTVTDVSGNSSTCDATVTVIGEIQNMDITVNPSPTIPGEVENTIFLGLGPQSVILNATGGTSYSWTSDPPGFYSNESNPTVSPMDTTTYYVEATNEYGCTAEGSITINVVDWRCGNNFDKLTVCHNGHTICISPSALEAHLEHGDNLGPCYAKQAEDDFEDLYNSYDKEDEIAVKLKQNYPNPFSNLTEIQYFVSKKEKANLVLTDMSGRIVANLIDRYVDPGWNTIIVNGSGLTSGIYILRLESLGKAAILKINRIN